MAALYRRSVIFSDIKNIIVSLDAVVATRLKRYFDEHEGSRFFFIDDIKNIIEMKPTALVTHIMAYKHNHNFLLDYFDWSKISLGNDVDPMLICDRVYEDSLAMPVISGDVLENPDISDLMTGIGKSFEILCNDPNLNFLYLYGSEYIPKEILDGLSLFYLGSNKIKFVSGDKEKFLKEVSCDSYFFEDSSDIDSICFKHINLCEVLVPNCEPNLTVVDQEKGTRLRLPVTNLTLPEYKKQFNLEVHTISLPI